MGGGGGGGGDWGGMEMERHLVSLWVSCEHFLEFGIPMGLFFLFFTILVSIRVQIYRLVSTPLSISRGRTPPPVCLFFLVIVSTAQGQGHAGDQWYLGDP